MPSGPGALLFLALNRTWSISSAEKSPRSTLTGLPINDSTAGFICYRRNVLETINLDKIKFVGYAFQIEMKFKTWKSNFDIVEVPVIFTDRKEGNSKMDTSIFFEDFIGVIQMKISSLFIKFKQKSKVWVAL